MLFYVVELSGDDASQASFQELPSRDNVNAVMLKVTQSRHRNTSADLALTERHVKNIFHSGRPIFVLVLEPVLLFHEVLNRIDHHQVRTVVSSSRSSLSLLALSR